MSSPLSHTVAYITAVAAAMQVTPIPFLPRDAMHASAVYAMTILSVHLLRDPSVTLVICVRTAEHTVKLFRHLSSGP